MAEGNVIKEFLVALGYKHDEAAAKKLKDGIVSVTKAVENLGIRIEATAFAVAYGVTRFASNLEQLYFSAQRVGSSADRLKAFDLAARNFGASMDEARGSVEGLASFLRNNPGGANVVAGWLGAVGLSARDANGQMLTGTALMAQLGKMFAIQRGQGRTFLANQMAGMLGISEKTMLAMSSPGFAQELEAQERRAKGWERVAEAAHRFMIQLENLKMSFYQMMLGFEGPAMAALQRVMTAFGRLMRDHGAQAIRDLTRVFEYLINGLGQLLNWLDTHGDEIQRRVTAIFTKIAEAYKIVKPALDFVYDAFVKLDKVTGGWSTNLLAVLATLKLLGATGLITGIASLGAGLAKALGGLAALSAVEGGAWASAGAAFGAAAALGIAGAIGIGIGYVFDKLFPNNWLAQFGSFLSGKFSDSLDQLHSADRIRHGNYVLENYNSNPSRAAALNAAYSPKIGIDIDINVNGAADPRAVGPHGKNEAEAAIRRAGYALSEQLTREFLGKVQ